MLPEIFPGIIVPSHLMKRKPLDFDYQKHLEKVRKQKTEHKQPRKSGPRKQKSINIDKLVDDISRVYISNQKKAGIELTPQEIEISRQLGPSPKKGLWGITKHKTLLIMETTSHMKTIVVPVTMETSVTMVMKLTEDMPSIMPRIIHCLLQDGGMRITGLIEIRHHLKEEAGAYWMPKQWPLILSLTKPLKSDLEKCIS